MNTMSEKTKLFELSQNGIKLDCDHCKEIKAGTNRHKLDTLGMQAFSESCHNLADDIGDIKLTVEILTKKLKACLLSFLNETHRKHTEYTFAL